VRCRIVNYVQWQSRDLLKLAAITSTALSLFHELDVT